MWKYMTMRSRVILLLIVSSSISLVTRSFTFPFFFPSSKKCAGSTKSKATTISWTTQHLDARNSLELKMVIPELDQWNITEYGEVMGIVQKHPDIEDGYFITTNALVDVEEVGENTIVTTRSGSQYKLLRERLVIAEEEDLTIPELDEWSLTEFGEVVGIVQKHASIDDGEMITTSALSLQENIRENAIVTTQSGSKYRLLKQQPAPTKERNNVAVTPKASPSKPSGFFRSLGSIPISVKKSIQSGINLNGKTVGNGRYLLVGKPKRSTSGKSQIWTAYQADKEGYPVGSRLAIKMSTNYEALYRESQNYDRVTNGLFYGQFVKKIDFLPRANGKGFESLSALVIEAGVKDLKDLLNERWGKGLRNRPMRDVALAAGQCIQAMHSSGMVWTDLKTENFVLVQDVDGEDRLKGGVKGIDLESAIPLGGNPVDYSPEACPPEFAKALVKGEAADFVLDSSYDMWSLGMMMYELSTGQPYFAGKSAGAIANMLQMPGFKPDVRAVQDTKLRGLVRQCLLSDPKRRPGITQFLLHPYFTTTGIGPFAF